MSTQHNDELIKRLNEGDTSAFRQLFDALVRPLVYFANQHINHTAEAEDIVSFAFQQAWDKREHFTKFAAAQSFLYVTVRNKCLDFLKHERVKYQNSNALAIIADQPQPWADARMIEAETLSLIYHEIEQLPEHHQKIIHLSFVEDLSTEEIARLLRMSPAHVRTARARALVMLRKVLAEKGLLKAAMFLLTTCMYK